MKKLIFSAILIFALCASALFAQQNPNPAGVITLHYAARDFAAGPIPAADLNLILQAGVRAPSAANRQPWHFTVVQNVDLAKKIISNVVQGNALIVISTTGDAKREIIDCALAAQSIYLAAQALGYGSRIYTGPIDNLNRDLKGQLGLPAGHNAVILVRVGKVEKVDAVSGASSRKAADSIITYK